ncbi:MAG TPA: DegQ family serine endoprotease [Stellaceae bacterium]|jgi:serine protease Do
MIVSYFRSSLAGALCAAVILAPAFAASAASANSAAGLNLTQAVQQAPIKLPSLAPLADRVLPAVVNVSVQLTEQAAIQDEGDSSSDSGNGGLPAIPGETPFDQFLRRFFQNPSGQPNPQQKIMALGSGFIIDPRGYIVTNNHVVANADKVSVIFQDHSSHPAKVVARDVRTDLALLKIDTKKPLPYVTWGDSNDVKVGDWVVAVGNPFGLGGTVTAGIVSALGRNINEGPYDDFLQIDAPINRGNSGGPTFDLSGQVVGINTAIYSPSGGSVGIGFAIPSNTAKYVISQLKAHGKVTWGWLGVAIQNVTPSIAKSLGLEQPQGALVASVVPNSPAANAGIKPGDVIVKAGDHNIGNVHDLPRLVAETPVGSKLPLTLTRDGKSQTVVADVGEMPANEEASAEGSTGQPSATASALGMQLAPLNPQLRSELKVGKDVSGVVVLQVADNSPVSALGIQAGDVIVSVDQKPVTTPQDAAVALKQAAKQGNILLLVDRHGTTQFVGLSIEGGGGSGIAGNGP